MSAALKKIRDDNRAKRAARDRAIAVAYLQGVRDERIGETCTRLAAHYDLTREAVRRIYAETEVA